MGRHEVHKKSGCAAAVRGLVKLHKSFEEANTAVVGVSNDPLLRGRNFAERFAIKFPLISDIDNIMGAAYGVHGHGIKQVALHRRLACSSMRTALLSKFTIRQEPMGLLNAC